MPKNSIAETFSLYRERLLKFIRSRTPLLEDTEDILQEVFYQFARMDSLEKPVEQASAWLYRAARNKIIDTSRAGRKKKDAPLPAYYNEDAGEYIFDEIADILYGTETTSETEYLRVLIIEEIQTALDECRKRSGPFLS
jgi:RNA polymerase sigma factor (sigma-70 family)